jgi:hypothetical protein
LDLSTGSQRVHHARDAQTLLLGNAGRFPLVYRVLLTPSARADGAVVIDAPTGTVEPGATARITLTVCARAPLVYTGVHVADVHVADDLGGGDSGGGSVVHSAQVHLSATAAFSAYALSPARSLHFGPLQAGTSKTRTLVLRNTGAFDFEFAFAEVGSPDDVAALRVTSGRSLPGGSLSTALGLDLRSAPTGSGLPATAVSPGVGGAPTSTTAATPASTKQPTAVGLKGGAAKQPPVLAATASAVAVTAAPVSTSPPTSVFGCFTVEGYRGRLDAGEACTVSVTLAAEGDALLRRCLRLHVEGFDHCSRSVEELCYDLVGESCVPCIVTDDAAVFEEHRLVEGGVEQLGRGPHHACVGGVNAAGSPPTVFTRTCAGFAQAPRVLYFGAVQLRAYPAGVVERVRLANPTKVPVVVSATASVDDDGCLADSGDAVTPAAGAFSLAGAVPATTTATPLLIEIAPYASVLVPIRFCPSAVGSCRGTVTFDVANRVATSLTPPAPSLRFGLLGEGALPMVSVMQPLPTPDAGGRVEGGPKRMLALGRVAVGARTTGCVVLRNDGVLGAVARLTLPTHTPFRFGPAHHGLVRVAADGHALELALSLAPNASADVWLDFAPSPDAHHAALTAAAAVSSGGRGAAAAVGVGAEHCAQLTVACAANPFGLDAVTLTGASLLADIMFRVPQACGSSDVTATGGSAGQQQLVTGDTLCLGEQLAPVAAGGLGVAFEMVNTCGRPVRFEWPEPTEPAVRGSSGDGVAAPSLSFLPRCGHIPARGARLVTATLLCADVLTPCAIDKLALVRLQRVTYESRFAGAATLARSQLPVPATLSPPIEAPEVALLPAAKRPPAPPTSGSSGGGVGSKESAKPLASGAKVAPTSQSKGGTAAIASAAAAVSESTPALPVPTLHASPPRVKRQLARPADEPVTEWDDAMVTTTVLPFTDPLASAALADGTGSISPDGAGVVVVVAAPEPPFAVIDDLLPLTEPQPPPAPERGDALVECSAQSTPAGPAPSPPVLLAGPGRGGAQPLADGGLVVPAGSEADATDAVPLRVTATVDHLRFEYSLDPLPPPPASAAASAQPPLPPPPADPTQIVFKPTFLFQSRRVGFRVANPSRVTLRYRWHVLGASASSDDAAEFVIEPAAGGIPPGGSQSFAACYAPSRAGTVCAQASLLLTDAHGACLDAAHAPPTKCLRLEGSGMRPVCHFELAPSDYLQRRVQSPLLLPAPQLGAGVRVLEITALGASRPVQQRFGIVNTTSAPLEFTWDYCSGGGGGKDVDGPRHHQPHRHTDAPLLPVRCLTPSGVIPPGRRAEMAFEFEPSAAAAAPSWQPGSRHGGSSSNEVEALFHFRVPASALLQPLLVVAGLVEPRVHLERAALAFPPSLVVGLGSSSSQPVALVNDEDTPQEFTVTSVQSDDADPSDARALLVEPSDGVIAPRSRLPLTLQLTTRVEKPFNLTVSVCVTGKREPLRLNVKGEGFALHEELTLLHEAAALPAPSGGSSSSGGGSGGHTEAALDASSAATGGLRLEPTSDEPVVLEAPVSAAASSTTTTNAATTRRAASVRNLIDFGDVQVTDSVIKRVAIANRGRFPLTVEWGPLVLATGGQGLTATAVDGRTAALGRSAAASSTRSSAALARSASARFAATTAPTATELFTRAFSVTPATAKVAPGDTVVCSLTYRPLAVGPRLAACVTATVSGVRTYALTLAASASRPALEFSSFTVDFGECFLPPPGSGVPLAVTRSLTLTNHEATRAVAVMPLPLPVDAATGRGGCFHVPGDSLVLAPGATVQLPVRFAPTARGAVRSACVFEVNGLHRVTVALAGAGIPLVLEATSPAGGLLSLGAVALGDAVARQVGIANRSKRHVLVELCGGGGDDHNDDEGGPHPLAVPGAAVAAARGVVAIAPRPGSWAARGVVVQPTRLLLAPRQTGVLDVRYSPPARAEPFNQPLQVRLAMAAAGGVDSMDVPDNHLSENEGGGGCRGFSEPVTLLQLAGACVGTSVRLEADELAFGTVCVGACVSRSILLVNDGDVAVDFSVAARLLPSGFEVAPTTGRAKPHSCLALTVAYRPRAVAAVDAAASSAARTASSAGGGEGATGGTMVVDCVACSAGSGGGVGGGVIKLPLRLLATSTAPPAADGAAVAFACRVRESVTQSLTTPVNASDTPVTIHPSVCAAEGSAPGASWSGAPSVTLPPRGTACYDVTYHPLTMTAGGGGVDAALPEGAAASTRPACHTGRVFFPLPDGSGSSTALVGRAGDPRVEGPLVRSLTARQRHMVALRVGNWLDTQQALRVAWDVSPPAPSLELAGAALHELPAGATREYKLHVRDPLPGHRSLRVTFTNDATGEWVTHAVALELIEPPPCGVLALAAPVRQVASTLLTVELPQQHLATTAAAAAGTATPPSHAFTVECAHPAVRVVQLPDGGGGGKQPPHTARFRVEFRPLVATRTAAAPAPAPTASRPASRNGDGSECVPPTGSGSRPAIGSAVGTAAGSKPPAVAATTKPAPAAGASPAAALSRGGTAVKGGAAAPAPAPAANAAASASAPAPVVAAVAAAAAAPAAAADLGASLLLCDARDAVLTLRSPVFGTFAYTLQLSASAPPPAARCELAAALGARPHSVLVPFRHFSTAPGVYAVRATPSSCFSAPLTVSVEGASDDAAAWEGVPCTVPVTFDGGSVGSVAGELVIAAAGGGAGAAGDGRLVVVPLMGTCSPPQPAGPFTVWCAEPLAAASPLRTLPFRNPFPVDTDFLVAAEPPGVFGVTPGGTVRVAAKATANLSLQLLLPAAAAAAATGRLTVTPATMAGGAAAAARWVFYLQAAAAGDARPPAAADAAAVSPAGAAAAGGAGAAAAVKGKPAAAAATAAAAAKPSVTAAAAGSKRVVPER